MISQDNPYRGSSLDDFLDKEGINAEVTDIAIKRVIAWQIRKEMDEKKITKTEMAKMMKTSRAQLDRVLNPDDGNITIDTIQKAAEVVGRKIKLELV